MLKVTVNKKRIIAALAIVPTAVLSIALASCSSGSTTTATAKAPAASTSAPAIATPRLFTDPISGTCLPSQEDSAGYCAGDDPSPSAPASMPDNTLACSTVIDATGWSNGPLTEVRGIAILSEFLVAATPEIMAGTLNDTELTTLGGVALDMENYQGSQLATDAGQFASEEQSYQMPGPSGDPENTAFALPLEKDILTLVKDCPGSAALRTQMTAS